MGVPVKENTTIYLKIFKDIPNNYEVLKKMIMLHTDLQTSEILGKVLSFILILHGIPRIGSSLHIFGKCAS